MVEMVRPSHSVRLATRTVFVKCLADQSCTGDLRRAIVQKIDSGELLRRTVKRQSTWDLGLAIVRLPHPVRAPVNLVTSREFFNTLKFVSSINIDDGRVYSVSIFLFSNGKIKVTGLPHVSLACDVTEACLRHVAGIMLGEGRTESFAIPRDGAGNPVDAEAVMTLGNFYLGRGIDMAALRWSADALNERMESARQDGHHLLIRVDGSLGGGARLRNHEIIACLVTEEEMMYRTSRYQLKLFANGAVTIVGNGRYPYFGTEDGLREIEDVFRKHVAPHV